MSILLRECNAEFEVFGGCLKKKSSPHKYRTDGLHIAIATVNDQHELSTIGQSHGTGDIHFAFPAGHL